MEFDPATSTATDTPSGGVKERARDGEFRAVAHGAVDGANRL